MRALMATATFLFGSGTCALIYQTVWLRDFRLIFGASTPSTAAVLAIFMGGLGLGGFIIGRRVEKSPRPLMVYANLEVAIALSAALTPFLLDGVRALYVGMGGSEALGGVGATFVRIALSVVVLGVPVFLMGGTMPAAARAVTTTEDVSRRGMAVLYGINTLGAVTGAVSSTFLLLEVFGARTTLWLACLVNLALAVAARGVARRMPLSKTNLAEPTDAPAPDAAARRSRRSLWVLAAAFVTGFVFFLVELVWYRMSSPILGGSTYSFGLVLACALFGMGAGGFAYAFAGPKQVTAGRFAVTCALEALFLVIPFALGDELARLTWFLREFGQTSFPSLVLTWAMVMFVIVVPAAFIAGYQFPLLLALKGQGDAEMGKDVGEVYAANTLGAIMGSLGGGFGLMPLLTAPGAWLLTVAMMLLLGLAYALRALRVEPARIALFAAIAAPAVLLSTCEGPTALWRHSSIGSGRGRLMAVTANDEKAINRRINEQVLREYEGVESSVAVVYSAGLSPLVNGKDDGNTHVDAITGIGSGLLPAVLHKDPKSAFVIGLGTGQTAGWVGAVPSIERVDVVEIEEDIVDFARMAEATNQFALNNPKVKLHVTDGREHLLVTRERYDLIFSEPSNPYRAGLASFYSVDFYRGVEAKLNEGGMFAQWVQAYEVEPAAVELVAATLGEVFPHVSAWQLAMGDILFVATKEPQSIDVDQLRRRVTEEPYQAFFNRVVGVYGAEGVLALNIAPPEYLARLKGAHTTELNSDDLPLLEFMFARSVGRRTTADLRVQMFRQSRRWGLPFSWQGQVDEAKVARQRARPYLYGASTAPPDYPLSPVVVALLENRRGALRAALAADETAELDGTDRLYRAFALASLSEATDAERAERTALIESVRAEGREANAAWLSLLAALSDRQSDVVPLCQAAAVASSRDPWGTDLLIERALQALVDARSPACGPTLAKPFITYQAEQARRESVGRMFSFAGDNIPAACVEFLDAQEPHTPWAMWALRMRARCYRKHRPERAPAAVADMDTFLTGLVPPLGANVVVDRASATEDPDDSGAATPGE